MIVPARYDYMIILLEPASNWQFPCFGNMFCPIQPSPCIKHRDILGVRTDSGGAGREHNDHLASVLAVVSQIPTGNIS